MQTPTGPPITAVAFDYYFTLVEPAMTDWMALASSIGCASSAAKIEEARRGFLAARPSGTPTFDGDSVAFRSFEDEWILAGDAIFGRLGSIGGGAAYAARRADAHGEAVTYPGVLETLSALRATGLKLGVFSDSDSSYFEQSLARLGFVFDAVLTSEEIQQYKPHRRCFEQLCALLGTDPCDTVYVGDSPLQDIAGSHRAGLLPVWINRRQLAWPDDLDAPHRLIGNLTELLELVGSVGSSLHSSPGRERR